MFNGALTENFVACHLYPKRKELFEVKSGRRTNSKSLNEYIKKYNSKYSIRLSSKNFGFENNIKSVPLYAIFCINDN